MNLDPQHRFAYDTISRHIIKSGSFMSIATKYREANHLPEGADPEAALQDPDPMNLDPQQRKPVWINWYCQTSYHQIWDFHVTRKNEGAAHLPEELNPETALQDPDPDPDPMNLDPQHRIA